jgi:hypothetical protein
MSKFVTKIIILFLLLCFTASAFAVQVPLKYTKYPDGSKSFQPSGLVGLKKTTKPPAGEWKMPRLVSEYPIYAFVKIGDKKRLCVLDRQKKNDIFYNRLYFDSNGNNDLTDDPVFDGTLDRSSESRMNAVFPAVNTTIEVDGKSLPYSFRPDVYTSTLNQLSNGKYKERNINRYARFYLRVNCSYSGEFKVNGQSYRVVLGDRNGNGRFNDRFTFRRNDRITRRRPIFATGDNIFITSGRKIDSYDEQFWGDLLLVKDKLFNVSISTAESKLTLTPVTKNLAALNLPMKAEQISLFTEDGKHCLNMYRPGKEIKVPKGKYRLLKYTALRKDEQGDMWSLSAGATTDSPLITVDGRGKSVLKFGEPYAPVVDVMELGGRSSRVLLYFNVEGMGKEFLTDLSHISGTLTRIPLSKKKDLGHRPKEPTYKIIKAGGEEVARGSFEYG